MNVFLHFKFLLFNGRQNKANCRDDNYFTTNKSIVVTMDKYTRNRRLITTVSRHEKYIYTRTNACVKSWKLWFFFSLLLRNFFFFFCAKLNNNNNTILRRAQYTIHAYDNFSLWIQIPCNRLERNIETIYKQITTVCYPGNR